MFFEAVITPREFVHNNEFVYVVNFIFNCIHANFCVISSMKFKHYLPSRANNLVHKQGKAISGSITVNVDIDGSIKIKSNLVHHDLTRGTFFIGFMKVNE